MRNCLEAKGEKCKIAFYAQNLKSADEKCHMALVCSKKDGNFILDLGLMNINSQGKAEASLECGTNNIGNLDVSYDKIIGAVVYKEIGGKVIYLMCGFLNGQQPKDNWKVYNILSKHGLIKKSKNDGSKKNEEKHNTNNKVEKENNEQRTVEQGIEREDTDIRLNSETRTENIDNLLDENVSEDMELNSAQVNDDILDEDINENESRFDEYENLIEARINGGNYEREADESYSELESQREIEVIKLDNNIVEDGVMNEKTTRGDIQEDVYYEKLQGSEQNSVSSQGITGIQTSMAVRQ